MQKILINKGDKYGRLTIIKEIESIGNRRYFQCSCDCGNIKNIQMAHFRGGYTISCGCYAKEKQIEQGRKNVFKMIKTLTTHGMSKTRFYRIYKGLNNRCNYQKYPEFKYYGGRGIKNEWNNFEEFKNDMYKSYLKHCQEFGEEQTTIDRINSNGNYCKDNCKWATYKQQGNNKRVKNGYKLDGTHTRQKIFKKDILFIKQKLNEGYKGSEIGKMLGVYKSCIYYNIKKYGLK